MIFRAMLNVVCVLCLARLFNTFALSVVNCDVVWCVFCSCVFVCVFVFVRACVFIVIVYLV